MLRQLLLLTLVGLSIGAPSISKINPKLQATLAHQGTANVVVVFNRKIDSVLDQLQYLKFASPAAKITFLKSQLEALQSSTQKNALNILSGPLASDVKYHSLWINNRLYIENANAELIQALGKLPEVSGIREQYVTKLENPVPRSNIGLNAEWGVEKIQAEEAWALPGGNNGAGAVVAIIDTGARGGHEAIHGNFREDHGWFDPYTNASSPNDYNGHGTHVTGTIAGAGGIGVAPGAQWISCRGCNFLGMCTEANLALCGQWTACPTLIDGSDPDCSKAPAVTSSSWGFPGEADNFFDDVMKVWHEANIIPVIALGNEGEEGCGATRYPGNSPLAIGIGATDDTDTISYFSSRGPVRNGTIKPDVSAPGSNIRSSWNTGNSAYNVLSGTSMATPHSSGVVALLKAKNPNLTVAQVKALLEENADRNNLGDVDACGGIPIDQFPNNIYGHGRINARKSLEAVINAD